MSKTSPKTKRQAKRSHTGGSKTAGAGNRARGEARPQRTRAQELRAIEEWKVAHPNGPERRPKPTVDEILQAAHAKWTAENPTVAGSSPAPIVQKSMRGAKVQQTQAPRRRDLGKTPAEMRASVLRNCEREIRMLVAREGAPVDPDAFLAGLKEVGIEEKADLERWERMGRGDQLLTTIRKARDEAQGILESQRELPCHYRAPLEDLTSIVDLLRGRSELNFCDPREEKKRTHLQHVLRVFGHDTFLYIQGRQASSRELAILSLYVDPDHGIDERRAKKKTFWQVVKAEEGAIGKARKRLPKTEPPAPTEADLALGEEIMSLNRAMTAARDRLPRAVRAKMPVDPFKSTAKHLRMLDKAGELVARHNALEAALSDRTQAVIVVRRPDGTLSDGDAESVRAAEAEARPVLVLSARPALEPQGILVTPLELMGPHRERGRAGRFPRKRVRKSDPS